MRRSLYSGANKAYLGLILSKILWHPQHISIAFDLNGFDPISLSVYFITCKSFAVSSAGGFLRKIKLIALPLCSDKDCYSLILTIGLLRRIIFYAMNKSSSSSSSSNNNRNGHYLLFASLPPLVVIFISCH